MSWFRDVISPLMIFAFPAWMLGLVVYFFVSTNEWLIWGIVGIPVTFIMSLTGFRCSDFIAHMVLTENRRWTAALTRAEARERRRVRSTHPAPR